MDYIKIQKPKEFENVNEVFKSHTLNEKLPYLPNEDCFFDSRHWVCGLTKDILPFSVTTRISENNQQFLKIMNVIKKDNLVAEPMVYDDYNSKFHQDQNIIGTITTQIGNPAPRHGFKIVEGVSVHPNSHALEFKGQESIKQDAAPSLRATDYKAPHCVWEKSPSYRIRKLTPRECFRLMGVSESDIDKIQASGVSQTQQYKLAGNSIVVDTLFHIFRKMFVDTGQETQQLMLF